MQPEAIGGDIFDGFFRDNFRLEAASDVISCADVQPVGVDVSVHCGNPRSRTPRDIRLPHLVTHERRRRASPAYAGQRTRPKGHIGVLPENVRSNVVYHTNQKRKYGLLIPVRPECNVRDNLAPGKSLFKCDE